MSSILPAKRYLDYIRNRIAMLEKKLSSPPGWSRWSRFVRARLLSGYFLLAIFLLAPVSANAQSNGATVVWPPGWNLVSGRGIAPMYQSGGIAFTANVYTLQPGDSSYESLPPDNVLQTGLGYWVYLPQGATAMLVSGSDAQYRVQAPPGQFVMVGNLSGHLPAQVTGADTVLTYDPSNGYKSTSILQPGQGALVSSAVGGVITVTPQTQS
jgi:hypothetical protein